MTYSIQTDDKLKYYVYFPQEGNGNINFHSDYHFYMTMSQLTDAETHLLMPASQDTRNWYYVFSYTSSANGCWTIGTGDGDRLDDATFTGADNQKWAFEDAGNGKIWILNKASGKWLYRSNELYYAHHPIRQAGDHDGSEHLFQFKQRTDKPVSMPAVTGAKVTDPNQLYTTTLLGTPPNPTSLNDNTPPPLAKVLIGETLLPFFNVSVDPEVVGDRRDWQVKNRPYYRYRREQQYQATGSHSIPAGGTGTFTHSSSWGIEQTTATSVVEHSGFTFGFNSSHSATMGMKGVSATASRGFSMQWTHDVTTTISESQTESQSGTVTETLELTGSTTGLLYMAWQVMDIWTVFYGANVEPYTWSVPRDSVLSKWYPPAATLRVSESVQMAQAACG